MIGVDGETPAITWRREGCAELYFCAYLYRPIWRECLPFQPILVGGFWVYPVLAEHREERNGLLTEWLDDTMWFDDAVIRTLWSVRYGKREENTPSTPQRLHCRP